MMGLRSTHLIGNQRTLCSLPFDWCCCPHFALSFPGYQSSSQFCKCGGIRTHISWSSPGASSRLSHLLAPRWLIATPHCSSGSLVLPYSVQSTHSKLYNSSPLCVQVPGAESRIRTGACQFCRLICYHFTIWAYLYPRRNSNPQTFSFVAKCSSN